MEKEGAVRSIFHIDANSAYLSWTAVSMLENGYPTDIRQIPAAIAGDPASRHGIILAKSIPAKAYGVGTGESLFEARRKCPNIAVFPPDYELYMRCSDAMYDVLHWYSPQIQRYSVDECFMDYTMSEKKFGLPSEVAEKIKERIKKELGFTVNIGISCNKLLAKMGSELKKPDRIHTLYPEEMERKMWPLPVGELFMVGRATERKLNKININTVGDLARSDPHHMKALLKSHGLLIWGYANGIDDSEVIPNSEIFQKGVGNSTTTGYDVTDKEEARKVLLALAEKVAMRLRKLGCLTSLVCISIKTDRFIRYGHQLQLPRPIDTTSEIYSHVCRLFDECWKGEPLRHLGVSVSDLSKAEDCIQLSFFDSRITKKNQELDKAVDWIRELYGEEAVIRGVFANSDFKPILGGTHDGDFIMMGGYKS
ncbi:MAG TPA: DNA polymerase IV [Bacillota bacterium]|jgi:DNA polymerase-4|nr:DNA polymerase IV [Bacillota bacterium]